MHGTHLSPQPSLRQDLAQDRGLGSTHCSQHAADPGEHFGTIMSPVWMGTEGSQHSATQHVPPTHAPPVSDFRIAGLQWQRLSVGFGMALQSVSSEEQLSQMAPLCGAPCPVPFHLSPPPPMPSLPLPSVGPPLTPPSPRLPSARSLHHPRILSPGPPPAVFPWARLSQPLHIPSPAYPFPWALLLRITSLGCPHILCPKHCPLPRAHNPPNPRLPTTPH